MQENEMKKKKQCYLCFRVQGQDNRRYSTVPPFKGRATMTELTASKKCKR